MKTINEEIAELRKRYSRKIEVPIICPDGVVRIGTVKQLCEVIERNLNAQKKKWWQI